MQLARYMNVKYYEDLLSTRTLFFPRYDNLSDQFEGSLGYVNLDRLMEEVESRLRQDGMPLKFRALNFLEELEPMFYHSFLKGFTFVSCWHQSVEESFHMWEMHGTKGVMIKSDLSSLKSSLGVNANGYRDPDRFWKQYSMKSLDGYEISLEVDSIKYVPLGHEIKAIGTDRYFHKQQAYEGENELRVLLQFRLGERQRPYFPLLFDEVPPPSNAFEMDNLIMNSWRNIERSYEKHASILNSNLSKLSESERGVRCDVEINSLIKEVVVNPFSEDKDSIMSEIKSLNHDFGVSAPVKESVIVNEPSPTKYNMNFANGKAIKFEL